MALNLPKTVHVRIAQGPEQGLEFAVQPDGSRIGRSSSNDIVLSDPSLSRFQCRLFFKDTALWVADLGSTNETLVNDKPVHEVPLAVGDRITIGETTIQIVSDRLVGASGSAPAAVAASGSGEPTIDLGLREGEPVRTTRGAQYNQGRRKGVPMVLWLLVGLVAAGAMATVAYKMILASGAPTPVAGDPEQERTLEVRYEKIQASNQNIFRYALDIHSGRVAVRMDDLQENRHIERADDVPEETLARLRQELARSGFFDLAPEQVGIAPGVFDQWDLTITVGRRTHRVRLLNRIEPAPLKVALSILEKFAESHLNLAPLALSPEQLRARAEDAFRQGRKMYDERRVRHSNLAQAIKSFQEVEWYLKDLEPKPPIYRQAIIAMQESQQELQTTYEEHAFRAERARVLRDWTAAAHHLRIILQLIPERTDTRHTEAERKLIDVERQMNR